MGLIIVALCCFRNYMRAKAANLKAGSWAFYTFLAMLASWIIGGCIVILILFIRDPRLRAIFTRQPQDRQALKQYLTTHNLIIPEIFVLFCMVGGYLFVRHLIIKRAGNPGTDIE